MALNAQMFPHTPIYTCSDGPILRPPQLLWFAQTMKSGSPGAEDASSTDLEPIT